MILLAFIVGFAVSLAIPIVISLVNDHDDRIQVCILLASILTLGIIFGAIVAYDYSAGIDDSSCSEVSHKESD
jgi:MFS family permease